MSEQQLLEIQALTRSVETDASLERDIVAFCAPVLAGIRPAAMFACPLTRKTKAQLRIDEPHVLFAYEFERILASCKQRLEPAGVYIDVLAHRDHSALLYVYRPDFAQAILNHPHTSACLDALGYDPQNFSGSLDELKNRLHAFDAMKRFRDFWDFPHEIGYFLGYPAPDVMAYTRNRGRGYKVYGTWCGYGCEHRASVLTEAFQRHADCTTAYWKLYLEGARLEDLATLGELHLQ